MIDVRAMTGGGTAVQAAAQADAAGHGASVAGHDDGAFQDELKSCVGTMVVAQGKPADVGGLGVTPGAPGGKAVVGQAGKIVVGQTGKTAVVQAGKPMVAQGVAAEKKGAAEPVVGQDAAEEMKGAAKPVVAKAGGATVRVEAQVTAAGAKEAPPVKAQVVVDASPVKVMDGVVKAPTGDGLGVVCTVVSGLVSVKRTAAKDDGVAAKKVDRRVGGDGGGIATEISSQPQAAVAVRDVAAAPISLGVVVPVALAVATPPAVMDEAAEAGLTVAGGSGRPAKVPEVKSVGMVEKKVEAGVAGGLKQEAGNVAVASVAGGGAHDGAMKEAVATAGSQPMVGVPVVTPVSVSAGHGSLAAGGVLGSKGLSEGEAVQQVAIPAAASAGDVKTLAATPNVLEVGIDSGTHGWLRVRAELGTAGEVTASMVASSAGQADTLRRELPAMSTYLAGESVGVSSLVVNATQQGAGAQDAAMSFGGAMQGGAEGRREGSAVRDQAGDAGRGSGLGEVKDRGVAGVSFDGPELPAAVFTNGSGNWLSVRV